LSTITRDGFNASFVHGSIDELATRAEGQGHALSADERSELESADLNHDGVIGNSAEEREKVFDLIDGHDKNGSRYSVSSESGTGYALASALQRPDGAALRQHARDDHAIARADFALAKREGTLGHHAEAATLYARAAAKFRDVYGTVDDPRQRYNAVLSFENAALEAQRAGNPELAAQYHAQAQAEARELNQRYPQNADLLEVNRLIASPEPVTLAPHAGPVTAGPPGSVPASPNPPATPALYSPGTPARPAAPAVDAGRPRGCALPG
jgi:hypothetical protein